MVNGRRTTLLLMQRNKVKAKEILEKGQNNLDRGTTATSITHDMY